MTYSVLTSLKHEMVFAVKRQVLVILAFLSVPIVNGFLKGGQIPVVRLIIPLLIGSAWFVFLRWAAFKRLRAHFTIDLSHRQMIYDSEGEPPVKKNFDDIRRISERMGEGLKIQFFDAKAEILISEHTNEYAEIKQKLATQFYFQPQIPTKILPFIFYGGIGAVGFELLFLRGTIVHGIIAVSLGLAVAFELLSTPEPISFFRRTRFLDRTTFIGSILVFLYAVIIILLGRGNS
jgi:hypothetical protein